MGSIKISIVSFILLNTICFIFSQETPIFSQEYRLNHTIEPVKLYDADLYTYFDNDSTIVTSLESGYEECRLPYIIPLNLRRTLGNGKLVAFTPIYTHFSILDFKNCSSSSAIHIDDGTRYYYKSEKEVHAVIPYYDTFDVYGFNDKVCNPCRYNDKGERLQINNTLKPEVESYDKYFLEPIKNISGHGIGYVFGFTVYENQSTSVRVLDSDYNVVKERSLNGRYITLSSSNGNLTVCTKVKICKFYDCDAVVCHLLDSDFNPIASVQLHNPGGYPTSINVDVDHLENGDVMSTAEYHYYNAYHGTREQKVFIQQIHSGGEVEDPINFGQFRADFVNAQAFMSNTGEYCVIASTYKNENGEADYSLVKCVVPEK